MKTVETIESIISILTLFKTLMLRAIEHNETPKIVMMAAIVPTISAVVKNFSKMAIEVIDGGKLKNK